MKTNQEIIKYFCEIMHPFNPNDVIIHKNHEHHIIFSIPHDAYDITIFNLMNEFLTDGNQEIYRLDIISGGLRLELSCIYPAERYI